MTPLFGIRYIENNFKRRLLIAITFIPLVLFNLAISLVWIIPNLIYRTNVYSINTAFKYWKSYEEKEKKL